MKKVFVLSLIAVFGLCLSASAQEVNVGNITAVGESGNPVNLVVESVDANGVATVTAAPSGDAAPVVENAVVQDLAADRKSVV